MKKAKKLILTIIIALISSLMMMSVSYAVTATVITETLRLRKAPTTDSNILRNLDAGDEVEVIAKEGDWYKISIEGYEGYIAAEYVKLNGKLPSSTENDNKNKNENETTEENKPTINETSSGEIKLMANTNIYILPVLISSPIKNIEKETSIKFIETINNWSNIEVDGVRGWVLNKYILNFDDVQETVDANATLSDEIKQNNNIGYINASSVNIRSKPSTDSKVIKTLVLNNEVKIIEKIDDWYKIKNGDGEAYVYANLVSTKKVEVTSRNSSINRTAKPISQEKSAALIKSASGNAVAEYAKQYIGYNYVYGGSGPTSFDCSGFTMFIYKKFGINLPHNAVTQSNYGKYVSKDNLVPGDLVIFNNYANTSIGHSAIYIGNGKIVHAANSNRGVTTDTILSGYYNIRFVEGRRLI